MAAALSTAALTTAASTSGVAATASGAAWSPEISTCVGGGGGHRDPGVIENTPRALGVMQNYSGATGVIISCPWGPKTL